MNYLSTSAAVFLLTLSFLSPALAQDNGMPPVGASALNGMARGKGMMGPGRFLVDPAKLSALKEKLALTSQQEPAWTAYAKAVTNFWDMRGTLRQSMQGKTMTMEAREALMKKHRAAGMPLRAELQKTREALSSSLTPEQRKTLDEQAPAMPTPPLATTMPTQGEPPLK